CTPFCCTPFVITAIFSWWEAAHLWQKQLKAAREKVSAGPSRGMWVICFSFIVNHAAGPCPKQSAGAEARWEEPDLPEIPKVHSFFASAWKKIDKDSARVKSGFVDPGYHFPKPTLLVNVSTPARKKTYLL